MFSGKSERRNECRKQHVCGTNYHTEAHPFILLLDASELVFLYDTVRVRQYILGLALRPVGSYRARGLCQNAEPTCENCPTARTSHRLGRSVVDLSIDTLIKSLFLII